MRYNNYFRMRDFFMNPRLGSIFPQFTTAEVARDDQSDEFLFGKVQAHICGVLGGSISGDTIIIGGDENTAKAKIEALTPIIEGFFDNGKSLRRNIRGNSRLYTTAASITQLADITDGQQKLKYLAEVLDNVRYNPDFGTPDMPVDRRLQREWERRAGYGGY